MQLWVGLGNPGPQYAMHRHNAGYMAADTIAEVHSFGPVQKKFSGWMQDGRIGAERVILLKPATFMNESGRAVGEALRFYKLDTSALTVFHDELDLAPFKVKVKQGGGTAGHNGLRSIDQHLGPDFRRVRIGIGHPGHKDRVTGYVLGNYAKSELDDLADMLGAIAGEADRLARGDDARFMSEIALRQQAA
jgi:PTH1 family peptidyl-tRNA hydrolase